MNKRILLTLIFTLVLALTLTQISSAYTYNNYIEERYYDNGWHSNEYYKKEVTENAWGKTTTIVRDTDSPYKSYTYVREDYDAYYRGNWERNKVYGYFKYGPDYEYYIHPAPPYYSDSYTNTYTKTYYRSPYYTSYYPSYRSYRYSF